MAEENNLDLSLITTLKDSDLSELMADLSDEALGAFDIIPVVGHIHKLWISTKNISTYLLLKKVLKFLIELKDVPIEQRQKQIAKLEVLTDERENVGEAVLLLLDKLNDMKKPAMMGKAFKTYLEGKISFEDLQTLNYAIEQINCGNIPFLLYIYSEKGTTLYNDILVYSSDNIRRLQENNTINFTRLRQLELNGLLYIHETQIEELTFRNRGYSANLYLNNPGRMFVEIILGVSLAKNDSPATT